MRVHGLHASRLLFLTDVDGVLDTDGKLIPELTVGDARDLIANGTISGGMIPKIGCCVDALDRGVAAAHIIDGRQPHSILQEILSDEGIGTMFSNDRLSR